ncbi:MAG: DUF3179 domain-containing protein [Actinomycetota bacterium]
MTLIVGLALVATACGTSVDGGEPLDAEPPETSATSEAPRQEGSTTTTSEENAVVEDGLPSGPSALDDPRAEAFPDPLVPVEEIISGGPPPDGIPPIDDPVFLDVVDALDMLEPAEAVVALEVNGDARAYPVRALVWHEIVNDTVGGVPVSVTYCPLCNSAATYRREIDGVETTFGTSGRLFASALVMYDRATESLWTHFDGRSVVGVLTGAELESIAAPLLAWEDFAAEYPDGQVLDWNETGFSRDYGRNPYFRYDDEDTQPFLFRGTVDDRAKAKQRVVGIHVNDDSAAYALSAIDSEDADFTATPVTVGGRDLVILWKAGQSSALEGENVADGRDVGSVGVFASEADGQPLTFDVQDGVATDRETGSTWDITGAATGGPLEGSSLERIEHLDTFWFAWSTYRPETTLIEG